MDAPTLLGDRYLLGELLGQGGMADVFRATDQLLDRPVAVKMLRDSATDPTDLARFTGKARTLAKLSHSGLVMVLDAGIDADRPFLVMEIVDGETLAGRLQQGPLDLRSAGSIGVQVAEALAYAHERGIVHRDVKPANVLLDPSGRVKLADFGIARLIGDTVRHTQTGHAIGTVAYLAPEQVLGRDLDDRSDVYSLGLLLLEALTGRREYPGSSAEAALARLSRPPVVPPELPVEWQRVLVSMTALDPADRPAAAEVARLLRGQPTAAIPVAYEQPPAVDPAATSATRVLTEPVTRVTTAGTAADHRIDRWGAWLAALPSRALRKWSTSEPSQRSLVVVLSVLVLFLVVVALLSGGEAEYSVPDGTPVELRQPLEDLHEAVNGG